MQQRSWGRVTRACYPLALVVLAIVCCTDPAAAQFQTQHYWVHADNGDDAWPGTRTQPFKRLNRALDVAWDYLHPGPGQVLGNPVEIHVFKSATPYAPVPQGFEDFGWMTDGEFANGCNRRPFPIRMIDNVDIIGIADASGNKPVITIFTPPTYTDWTVGGGSCNTSLVHATVEAASSCRIEGVLVDGFNVLNSAPPNDWPGVFIGPVTNFEIVGCDVRGWHDQLCFDGGGGTLSALVTGNSTLTDAWPLNTNEGHASVWVRGPGNITVEFRSSTISGSHDGVEVDGNDSSAVINFTLTNCIIENNENGLESVDVGALILSIESCTFRNNFNRPAGGLPLSQPVAAIANRGMTVTCTVRRTHFINNAVAVYWAGGGGMLDLGTESPLSLGENSFCLNYGTCIFASPSENAYRTCVWQRAPTTVRAAGNYWLAFNQGASGTGPSSDQDGRFLTGTRTFVSSDNMPLPPGPGVECTDGAGQQHKRNFAIENTGGVIDFGSSLPDFVPLPPPCPICGSPCPP